MAGLGRIGVAVAIAMTVGRVAGQAGEVDGGSRRLFVRHCAACRGRDGTLDELFEVATVIRCGKRARLPVALVGERSWAKLRTCVADVLVGEGAVAREELSLAEITDSPAEALPFIEATLAT